MNALAFADTGTGLVVTADALIVCWRRRAVGALMLAVSGAWFAGMLSAHLLFLHRGPLVHLHLAYPTGRIRRWPAWSAVSGGYVWAVLDGWVTQPAVTAVVACAVAGAALDGFIPTRGPVRRAAVPGLAAALVFSGVLGLSAINQLVGWQADQVVALVYDLAVAGLVTWLAVDVLRGRWTEATIAELVTQLGRQGDAGFEATLRRVVGDPGLTVRAGVAEPGPGQVATPILDSEDQIATLLHQPGLLSDARLLGAAVEVARLNLLNQRLRIGILGRAETLEAARRRFVEVEAEQRRQVAMEVAAGPVAELEAARDALGSVPVDDPWRAEAAELLEGIGLARAQLELFTGGLRPDLTGGLAESLPRIAEMAAIPATVTVEGADPPTTISETVWFVCSEAITNAAKHSGARHIAVAVRSTPDGVDATITDDGQGGADPQGHGLLGLADRVAAVDGRLTIHSPPGRGTIVTMGIPLVAPR